MIFTWSIMLDNLKNYFKTRLTSCRNLILFATDLHKKVSISPPLSNFPHFLQPSNKLPQPSPSLSLLWSTYIFFLFSFFNFLLFSVRLYAQNWHQIVVTPFSVFHKRFQVTKTTEYISQIWKTQFLLFFISVAIFRPSKWRWLA